VPPPSDFWFHKSSSLLPIMSQVSSVHTTSTYLSKIHLMLSTHLHLSLPSGLFPSSFPTNNLYMFLFFPIHATCPTNFILYSLIILIILGKVYKSCSSSLCSFHPPPPITSSIFSPNILLSTLFSNILSVCSSLNVREISQL
jgi:hypothetical protein